MLAKETNGISQKTCVLLVSVQPHCSREYSRHRTELCGLEFLLCLLRVLMGFFGNHMRWDGHINCQPSAGGGVFLSKTGGGRGSLSEGSLRLPEVATMASVALSALSLKWGRNPDLCFNIFAFVLVAEINLGAVSMDRNDLFLLSLTHFLCQDCCSWAMFRNKSCLLTSCLLVCLQKVLVFVKLVTGSGSVWSLSFLLIWVSSFFSPT